MFQDEWEVLTNQKGLERLFLSTKKPPQETLLSSGRGATQPLGLTSCEDGASPEPEGSPLDVWAALPPWKVLLADNQLSELGLTSTHCTSWVGGANLPVPCLALQIFKDHA